VSVGWAGWAYDGGGGVQGWRVEVDAACGVCVRLWVHALKCCKCPVSAEIDESEDEG